MRLLALALTAAVAFVVLRRVRDDGDVQPVRRPTHRHHPRRLEELMTREPGLKAQIAAGIVAVATLVLQRYLGIAPGDPLMEAIAPLIAYGATQVAGWLWTRRRTTPIASPRLPEGTMVTTTDAAGATTGTTTV